ncbi:MAG: protein-S-isoprenylcysteine methyltransferase [Ignavibacteriae bacterium]|nr:protein-S-isoprenylcysteine methyltransferase [Ignavibacteriota bacterium]
MKYLLVVFLWTLYVSLHSYLISTRFTNLMNRLLKEYYAFYRLFYILISLILLIPLINFANQIDDKVIIVYESPFSVIRYIMTGFSLLIFFYAFFFNYDSLSFFGIRQIMNFKKEVKINPTDTIKRNGLLGLIRHPMYFALIIYLWCQTFRMMDIYVNVLLTLYVIIGTILEEKKLVLEFGNAYVKYQKEVPMLIPFTKKIFK